MKLSAKNLENLTVKQDFKYRELARYVDGNHVVIGMRRLGKTEFLKYRALTSNLSKDEILYIDLSNPVLSTIDFSRSGSNYELFIESMDLLLSSKQIKLVLIDEIQKWKDWSSILKGYIDAFPSITFVATGSDALELSKSGDTGVGRYKIIYAGPLLYKEVKKMRPEITFEQYIDYYSFPQGEELDFATRYQSIIEKQVMLSRVSKVNFNSVLVAIALNPGIKLSKYKLANIINGDSKHKIDTKQIETILDFLIQSNLIISTRDKDSLIRAKQATQMTLYPYDWNLYKYYSIDKHYNILESKITENNRELPTKGFVFENMVVSNVISSLHTSYDKNRLFNKISEPDIDFILNNKNYEVKSFDVLSSPLDIKLKIIEKSKIVNSSIIHTGLTATLNDVAFVNVEEFLLSL